MDLPIKNELDCYLVSLGEPAQDYTVKLLQSLRLAGFSAERDYLNRKLKAQMKAADRLNAKFVAILGEDELKANKINVKIMESGEQRELSLENFLTELKALNQ